MNALRPLLALVCLAVPIWLGLSYSEHHSAEGVFQTLYMHLMPARLVAHGEAPRSDDPRPSGAHAGDEHGADAQAEEEGAGAHGLAGHASAAALVSVPLPGFLAVFDSDPAVEGAQLVLTNLQLFQIAAVLLVFVLFSGVVRYVRTGQGDYLTRLFTGFVLYVRDEMVYPVMGRETGRKFLPFFLSIFFFILFMNLMGLLPGSATATASIFVTGALACITLASMVLCGMAVQGPVAFWKNLVPHVPLALWPLMFAVELIGLLVKPFALMVRLFANMTGGHMVVLSFMGLIFFFGQDSAGMGYASSPVAVGFAVFIMIIEVFVAMLQAYIFTTLSILFVQASVHPEH